MPHLTISNAEQADELMERIRGSAGQVRDWIASQTEDPLAMLRSMKFKPVGFHPVEGSRTQFG